MAIVLSDNLNVATNAPVDVKYGPYSGVDVTAAKLAANTAVGSGVRFEGLTVGLIIAGADIVEYWYKGGILDTDLVVKGSGSGSSLETKYAGTPITTNTASYDFIGSGVLISNVGDDVTVSIPGGAGPAYNWILGDSTTTRIVSAAEQVNFAASGTGITVGVGPSTTSPYTVRIANNGSFTVSDDAATPNTAVISTGLTTQTLKFKGTNGITTTLNSALKELTIDGGGASGLTLNHNKMWSGDASNSPIESDILEASNIPDSNYFSVIGDEDTYMQVGEVGNEINFLTEIYSRQVRSLILGSDNEGAHTANRSVTIGKSAVKQVPNDLANTSEFVVIGEGANSDPSGSWLRGSVVIGKDSGHIANPPGGAASFFANYNSVVIGAGAGNLVGWRDIMIGAGAGSNTLQKSTGFPNIVIGYNSYSSGDAGFVFGTESWSNGVGLSIGYRCSPKLQTQIYNTAIGYQTTVGSGAIAIGYQSSSNTNGISIGFEAGEFWDDNNGEDAYNYFIGYEAGRGDVSGDSRGQNNIAIGNQPMLEAGYDGGSGLPLQAVDRNICIGHQTGRRLRSNSNIAIGHLALRSYNQTHYTNQSNIAIGDESARELAGTTDGTANANVMVGSETGVNLTTGRANVLLGCQAGMTAVDSNNVIIGQRAQYGNGTITGVLSNTVIIGNEAYNDTTGTIPANSVNIGALSIGAFESVTLGYNTKGSNGGLALGKNANQRNKGAAGNVAFKNLISFGTDIASAFNDSVKGDAEAGAGNYCFANNAEAVAAGLKHGDVYVESEGVGSNTPNDPARLCIVLQTVG